MYNFLLKNISFLAILISIVTHELAHGLVAYWNGDDTAKNHGRLTLNPLKHLTLSGTLMLIIFKFGWAKPVPINENNFKNKRLGLFLVSIAGILINYLTSFFCVGILVTFEIQDALLFELIKNLAWFGIIFGTFNLLPIPPLDGSKIFASFLPDKVKHFIYKYENYSFILLILLLYMGIISKFLGPISLNIVEMFIKIFKGLGL